MNIINLTPHQIAITLETGLRIIDPSGLVARIKTQAEEVGSVEGIPIIKQVKAEVRGLPEPVDNTLYIVSGLVAQFIRRHDVVTVDTGPTATRNEYDKVVAVKRLQIY